MKVRDETPTFDFDAVDASTSAIPHSGGAVVDEVQVLREGPMTHAAPGVEVECWREVPQARFLSWSPRMQAAYCRDRDLASSECAESEAWAQFYLRRANTYDEDARSL